MLLLLFLLFRRWRVFVVYQLYRTVYFYLISSVRAKTAPPKIFGNSGNTGVDAKYKTEKATSAVVSEGPVECSNGKAVCVHVY